VKILTALLATMIVSSASWAAESDGPIVRVYEEPRHRVLWGSSLMHILELRIPPGDTTLFHSHRSPIFYITLQDSALKTQVLGEEWRTLPARNLDAGTVRSNETYQTTPVIHRVANIGEDTVQSILILNHRLSVEKSDLRLFDSLPGVPESDGFWFSQSRLVLEGHEIVDWDGVDDHVVFVLASESHVTIGIGEASPEVGLTSLWRLVYLDASFGFRFENHGEDPATIIAVALL